MRKFKRLFLVSGVLVVICVVLVGATLTWGYSQSRQSNVGDLAFSSPLAIPPLLEPMIDDQGRKVFDLAFTSGETELLPGQRTETWGLNGPHLSPTLRASRGDEVVVNVTNGVNEATSLHWHGMHLPAAMDGGPHQMIAPREIWAPTWTVDQPAATLWFHPHPHGATADHVYQGAAGLFLINDDEAGALDLPQTYGVDDIPLIIQDKRFNDDGSLDMSTPWFNGEMGVMGDTILVNGTYDPSFEATTSLVRFRVLNASNARVYNLGFTDDRPYWVVGSDAGLLEAPVEMTRLLLSPGERVELVITITPDDEATLRSFPPDLGLDFFSNRFQGGDDTFDLLRIRGAARLAESPALPTSLVDVDRPREADAERIRTFALQGTRHINGERMDMSRVDAVVTVGTTEIWEIQNQSGNYHNFHVHLVHFAILDINGEAPPAHLQGWKDTVFLPGNSTVRIIARFDGYSDPDTPYMFHCHILLHEDQGMMGQFVVVEPGADPPRRLPADSHQH